MSIPAGTGTPPTPVFSPAHFDVVADGLPTAGEVPAPQPARGLPIPATAGPARRYCGSDKALTTASASGGGTAFPICLALLLLLPANW